MTHSEVNSHEALCRRAVRWLSGSRRCEPVFSKCASCSEIPDAIGWSSSKEWTGSTVVECKISIGDFRRDKRKYFFWRHRKHGWRYPLDRIKRSEAAEQEYELIEAPRMGDFRFYLCPPGVLSAALVEEKAPDHGLLYIGGRRIQIVREAPRREASAIDKDSEIRFLRFAIINQKPPHGIEAPNNDVRHWTQLAEARHRKILQLEEKLARRLGAPPPAPAKSIEFRGEPILCNEEVLYDYPPPAEGEVDRDDAAHDGDSVRIPFEPADREVG